MLPYTGLDSRETFGHILVVDSIAADVLGSGGRCFAWVFAWFSPWWISPIFLPSPTITDSHQRVQTTNWYSVTLRIILRALSPETQPISPTRYYSAN